MASVNHNDTIKLKMTQLANVTTPAQNRITAQILSNAAREMQENLGSTDYEAYIAAFNALEADVGETPGTFSIFDGKTFDVLTDAEKSLRNLIFAEAYFGLHYLAHSLKKLVKGDVNVQSQSAGGASISASPYDEIIANAETFRENAFRCLSFVSDASGTDDEDADSFFEGSFGVFTT